MSVLVHTVAKPRHRAASAASAPAQAIAVSAETWDRQLADFLDVSYDQSATYSAGKWGRGRTSQCVVVRDGQVIGGACVVTLTPPLVPRGLAYVKFGPLWRRRGALHDEDRYRTVVEALFDEYGRRRGHLLTIVPRPHPRCAELEYRVLRKIGFRIRRPIIDADRYFVDLALSADEQMASLGQKWRYNLRKALAQGIVVRERPGLAGYAELARLHEQMVTRKRFDDKDAVELLPEMAARLPVPHVPRTFLALQGERPVAGAVIGCLGDTAYYLFGASSAEALLLRAGYALQWHIVEALRLSGIRWYDLGGGAMDEGLRQFKRGLVGRRGVIHAMPGEFDRWTNALGRLAAESIYGARGVWRLVRSTLTRGRKPD